jgi:hypothetical protein
MGHLEQKRVSRGIGMAASAIAGFRACLLEWKIRLQRPELDRKNNAKGKHDEHRDAYACQRPA